jgi:hypothetical protein
MELPAQTSNTLIADFRGRENNQSSYTRRDKAVACFM